ncbi:hypothetical protein ACFLKB_01330 [Clostridium sp. FAM 1755]|uniref:Uncharacterized protein n=2 Tax=Clostridium TaxID=1485 RepID=A0A6M0T2D4_CLOBO|nr:MULTISPECIES: hypothetical protein [Clostridium]EJP6472244.1 hypothetical protein [Clostridium botulinum]KOR25048.1 membrane protein [Clostridium sp. L74]MDS1004709.1 hypothetical protein [Clostridium sporogenes]NFA61513.1 hypothetical protein [Clostridium botulinum]NFI74574.1 hypothetical protein [Clostridium sporogenes]
MRKYINLLGWIMVIITTVALLATLLTIYQFTYIKYFDSYYTLQWCMFFTMIVWSVKMLDFSKGMRDKFYSLVCIFLAIANIFFIYMKVY